jgi:hypothetical protein
MQNKTKKSETHDLEPGEHYDSMLLSQLLHPSNKEEYLHHSCKKAKSFRANMSETKAH